MAESPVRETCDAIVNEFVKAIRSLSALEGFTLNEQAQAVEHTGRRLRDECCGNLLLREATLANQILTIASKTPTASVRRFRDTAT